MSDGFYRGQRLSFEGNLSTVQYVGSVKGTKGEWLGVEWDDSSRGKHAGSHNGVTYFNCLSTSRTAASFVRPNRPHDEARTFVEALKRKYVANDIVDIQSKASSDNEVIRISGKDVEEVGFDKIRRQLANLKDLSIIVLDGQCIGTKPGASIAEHVSDVCPNTTELDISRNLFDQWREVIDIIVQLPKLRTLKADGNRFYECPSYGNPNIVEGAFSVLHNLHLEDCLLRWDEICSISAGFGHLRTLSIARNDLGLSPMIEHHLPTSLTSLSLEGNGFTSLCDLRSIAGLVNLRTLNLKNNDISKIQYDQSNNGKPVVFTQSLSDVDLAFNKVSQWVFVNELVSVFPGIQSLRLSHNPIFDNLKAADGAQLHADDAFMLVLARIGPLKRLNFSQITAKERLNAETYYLSQISKELSLSPEQDEARIIAQHPRFSDLCKQYGDPVIIRKASSEINADNLAGQLVKCRIHPSPGILTALADENQKHLKEIEMEIPRSFSIYNVLGIVGKRFNLAPMLLELAWETDRALPETPERSDEDIASFDVGLELDSAHSQQTQREVILVPRTRKLGTWLDLSSATLRLQWSEEDVERRNTSK